MVLSICISVASESVCLRDSLRQHDTLFANFREDGIGTFNLVAIGQSAILTVDIDMWSPEELHAYSCSSTVKVRCTTSLEHATFPVFYELHVKRSCKKCYM